MVAAAQRRQAVLQRALEHARHAAHGAVTRQRARKRAQVACNGGGGGPSKRKSDKAGGDFALQWLRGVGACGWVQQRLVLLLQTTYRCALLLLLLHLACARLHPPSAHASLELPQVPSRPPSAGARDAAHTRLRSHAPALPRQTAVISSSSRRRWRRRRRRSSSSSSKQRERHRPRESNARVRGAQERTVHHDTQRRQSAVHWQPG